MPAGRDVTYDRPVKATLHVHLDNGEQFEATPEDLARFGYIDRLNTYMRFDTRLREVLTAHGHLADGGELTDAKLNPLRYFVETVLMYPDLLDHAEHEGWREVAELEGALRGASAVVEP